MISFEEKRKQKIDEILSENTLTFGELIRKVRNTLGIKLFRVCEELGFDDQKLRILELGRFYLKPQEKDVKLLAEYYHIPYHILETKIDEHLQNMHKMRNEKGLK